MKKKTLLIAYGNVDREDDGVSWHILQGITQHFGMNPPSSIEEDFPPLEDNLLHMLFVLQLSPELSETVSDYERVCFIDAHTGAIPENVQLVRLDSNYQPSPMTHHMTPQTCLALAESLYQKRPEAILVSVRGHNFGFSQELSHQTLVYSKQAVYRIIDWLSN